MGTRVPFARTQDIKTQQPTTGGQPRPPNTTLTGNTNFQLRSEARLHTRFWRRSTTQKQSTTRQHWAASAIHRSEGKHKTVAHSATHRVVSPRYGRLSGGVRIHSVDDCLPLPFLVDLPKAPTGLSVRGLSLKVLLIFIHIVHLEMIGREVDRERGSDCLYLHSRLPPPQRKHKYTLIPKTPPSYTTSPIPPPPPPPCLPPLSLRKNRSVCRLHSAHLRQRVLTKQKKRETEIERNTGWGIWSERVREGHKERRGSRLIDRDGVLWNERQMK